MSEHKTSHIPSGTMSLEEVVKWQSDRIEDLSQKLSAAVLFNEAQLVEIKGLLNDISVLHQVIGEKG